MGHNRRKKNIGRIEEGRAKRTTERKREELSMGNVFRTLYDYINSPIVIIFLIFLLFTFGMYIRLNPFYSANYPVGEADTSFHFQMAEYERDTQKIHDRLPIYASFNQFEEDRYYGYSPILHSSGAFVLNITNDWRSFFFFVAFIDCLTGITVFVFVRKVSGSNICGLVSMAFMIVSYRNINTIYTGQWSQLMGIMFIPLFLYFFFDWLKDGDRRALCISGVILGLSFLATPVILIYLMPMIFLSFGYKLFLVIRKQESSMRKYSKDFSLFILFAIMGSFMFYPAFSHHISRGGVEIGEDQDRWKIEFGSASEFIECLYYAPANEEFMKVSGYLDSFYDWDVVYGKELLLVSFLGIFNLFFIKNDYFKFLMLFLICQIFVSHIWMINFFTLRIDGYCYRMVLNSPVSVSIFAGMALQKGELRKYKFLEFENSEYINYSIVLFSAFISLYAFYDLADERKEMSEVLFTFPGEQGYLTEEQHTAYEWIGENIQDDSVFLFVGDVSTPNLYWGKTITEKRISKYEYYDLNLFEYYRDEVPWEPWELNYTFLDNSGNVEAVSYVIFSYETQWTQMKLYYVQNEPKTQEIFSQVYENIANRENEVKTFGEVIYESEESVDFGNDIIKPCVIVYNVSGRV